MHISPLLTLLLAATSSSAIPTVLTPRHDKVSLPLPHRVVYQFPTQPNWIENIAVQPSGALLFTMLTAPELYQLASPTTLCDTAPPKLIHNFAPTINTLLGIAETTPDVFVTVGGNFSSLGVSVPGSFSLWQVDLTGITPVVSKVVDLPDSLFLNGVTVLPWDRNIVLVADSTAGKLIRVNVAAKTWDVAIAVPEMVPPADAELPIGINGVQMHGDFLYFSNSGFKKIYRVRLNKAGAIARGATVELIASLPVVFIDDIAVDEKNLIWGVTNLGNQLFAASKGGKFEIVLGEVDQLTLAGSTALAFGRTPTDKETLYVVTGGGLANPVNGTFTEGGKIVAVDTRGYRL